MYRALVWKEFRETWWMGVAACFVLATAIWNDLGLYFDLEDFRLKRWRPFRLPFRNDEFTTLLAVSAGALGAALGFWQTLSESVSGTWPFLMHRPLTRRDMLLTKLGTGVALIGLATGLPVLLYTLWMATVGSQMRPFRWWMTTDMWLLWFMGLGVYLAAFLCGLREARWHVSRLWPLVPAVGLPAFWGIGGAPGWWLAVAVLLDAVLLGAIAHAARERDYA